MKRKSSLESEILKFIKRKINKHEYIPLRKIGEIFGVSHSTVLRYLKKNGLYEKYKSLRNIEPKLIANSKYHLEQVKLWKKKYEQLKKELGFETQLINLFKNEIIPFKYKTKPSLNFPSYSNSNKRNEEPVLIFSDIHYGSQISPDETMMMNNFNTEIAKQRIFTVYNKFLETVKKLSNYKKVNLWLLGDLVEGIIHDDLLTDVPIVEQILEISEILSEIVYDLSSKFEEVEVVGVVGNHGRTKQKIYFKQKYSNFDYLVYKYMEIRCSNLKNVKFFIPKSPILIVQKFNKFNFLLRHGDGKSYSYAGIPVYGILRQSSKLQQSISAYKDLYIHYEILGHYHSSMELPKPLGSIIVCGSIKGIDEFSFNNFLFNEASQTMLLLNEIDGVFARIELKC